MIAVSFNALGKPYRLIYVDAKKFRTDWTIGMKASDTGSSGAFVSNGPPLPNMRISIVSDEGITLQEGNQGYV